MTNEFELDDLIRVARRENNTKRSYLYVNPLQGKHIPVSPSRSLALFRALAEKAGSRYRDEKLLIIGFAETATAIGSAIAYYAENCAFYMSTTREEIPGAEYLFFTESHSHASEQRLAANGLAGCLQQVDRVVFAEDEVTTGNTIMKLVRLLQATYPEAGLRFGIVSILNSMPDQRLQELQEEGIHCDFLHRIPPQYHADALGSRTYLPLLQQVPRENCPAAEELRFGGFRNTRMAVPVRELRGSVDALVQQVLDACSEAADRKHILVLGTEECMFPGMLLGSAMEARSPGAELRFHATTRSPIEVCADEDYPLHSRVPLESIYEQGRRTFLYNLSRYDSVFIVTDAPEINPAGLTDLCAALGSYGNQTLRLIRWGAF